MTNGLAKQQRHVDPCFHSSNIVGTMLCVGDVRVNTLVGSELGWSGLQERNVLDRTSDIVEFTLQVLWAGMCINVLDGTADGVQRMFGYWRLYCLLSAVFPLLSLLLQRLLWRRTWGNGREGGEAIHIGPKLMHLHRYPNICYARGNSGSLPLPFEITTAAAASAATATTTKSQPEPQSQPEREQREDNKKTTRKAQ